VPLWTVRNLCKRASVQELSCKQNSPPPPLNSCECALQFLQHGSSTTFRALQHFSSMEARTLPKDKEGLHINRLIILCGHHRIVASDSDAVAIGRPLMIYGLAFNIFATCRCMDVQHKQALRDSICHRLGTPNPSLALSLMGAP